MNLRELLRRIFAGRNESVSVSIQFGSGYDARMDMPARVAKLKELCDKIVSEESLNSRDITGDGKPETFCNMALNYVAEKMGCTLLKGKLANEIHEYCQSKTDEFDIVRHEKAAQLAMTGALCFASLPVSNGSGHVATVYPLEMVDSPSLNRRVPWLANVGKPPNGIKPASACFPVYRYDSITWFVWRPSV